ncbi:MAG: extracellular solute-binding protein, partial [Clostridia bacterium]|nr:extracellular solute-binding protein [Clostridia bacterium]
MKKLICLLLCALMAVAIPMSFFGCGTPRGELLKIYMPGDYIDESIFEEFEKWYKDETGKTVSVEIEIFSAVEDIQRDVEDAKTDYDLLCPSDYMVEYLISKKLLLEIDKSAIDVEADGLFREEYLDSAREYDSELKYSVPYMYGTLGIVYDITKTDGQKITSWDALFGNDFAGHRSVKKSMRDAYAAACIYNARNDEDSVASLSGDAQKTKIQAIFEDATDTTIANAKTVLQSLKNDSGTVWDTDDVKFEMAANDSDVAVALMWSCDAGYVMNDYEDADGVDREGNRNLWYVVPDEGGNVYIDNFVISKYAENVEAAN